MIPSSLYSTGSSTVVIFVDSFFISFSEAYKEVDFPDPVGPDTTTIPYGCEITLRKIECIFSSKPKLLRLKPNPDLSSNRRTVFSP